MNSSVDEVSSHDGQYAMHLENAVCVNLEGQDVALNIKSCKRTEYSEEYIKLG